ncbi:MAG: hypothetical protein HFH73_07570 [Lachnospiraceae bacterium]|jgi:hypothetical protein|nr:hypothetical protein [Lachnospiraceae bacterium]
MGNQYTVDGYVFQNASDYERALKEKETIAYLSANTDMANMKDVYKIYKLSVEKKSFQTVFGLVFLEELRKRLLGSETVTEDILEPIPTGRIVMVSKEKSAKSGAEARELNKYKEAYQKAKSGSVIKNFLILVLIVVIGVMLFITSRNQYSIFTYFTNYEENIRNEIVNEYEEWQQQLEEKEKELEERELKLP